MLKPSSCRLPLRIGLHGLLQDKAGCLYPAIRRFHPFCERRFRMPLPEICHVPNQSVSHFLPVWIPLH